MRAMGRISPFVRLGSPAQLVDAIASSSTRIHVVALSQKDTLTAQGKLYRYLSDHCCAGCSGRHCPKGKHWRKMFPIPER
jgi:hypothetical protein